MPARFQESGASVYDFAETFVVRCPRCNRAALVRVSTPDARLTCAYCGLAQARPESRHVVQNTALDWYFGLPLWLQTACCGDVLWARNSEHLAFLEHFVDAELRERHQYTGTYRNKLLASRLPRWMKLAANRDEIRAGLARLRELLRAA